MADMPGMNRPNGNLPPFKGQPWTVFDTVASTDYTVGSTTLAVGSQLPAISGQGEMIFFSGGRNRASYPQLTNMDQNAQLSYGMEVHTVSIEFKFPVYTAIQALNPTFSSVTAINQLGTVPPTLKLAEAIINWSTVELDLGQEEQMAWQLSSFGNGGGLWTNANGPVVAQNGFPDINCLLDLPEPIEMGRTQNMVAKIKISPLAFAMIGVQGGVLGVGQPLQGYGLATAVTPTVVTIPQLPYAITMRLGGKRIKDTQYGMANG